MEKREQIIDLLNKCIIGESVANTADRILDLFAVSGWLEFEGNESIFNEYAKRNCLCRFDDGTECRYEDEHPMAVLTHFRCK